MYALIITLKKGFRKTNFTIINQYYAIILIFLSIFHFGSFAQTIDCPGSLPSRLLVSQTGRVNAPNGSNLREQPTTTALRVGTIPQDAVFQVIDGPICNEGYTWWELQYKGRIGWAAESGGNDYWLESHAPLYQELRYGDVQLFLDKNIAASGTVEEKSRIPIMRNGEFELANFTHIRFSFADDLGQAHLSVIPARAYDELTGGKITRLQTLLDSRSTMLDLYALPESLPSTDMTRVLVTQPRYITFDGGLGLRFVAHYSYAPDFIANDELYYVFLGLTDDGEQFIEALIPISTLVLPSEKPEDFDNTPYAFYLTETQVALDAAESGDFEPTLRQFDNFIATLRVPVQRTEETIPIIYGNVSFELDTALAPSASGSALDENTASSDGQLPLPAHIRFTLDGYPTVSDLPHVMVIPTETLNFMYVGIIDEMIRLLDNDSPTPSVPLRLPITPTRRRFEAQAQSIDFNSGQGVRFLAHFSDEERVVTQNDIAYVFAGLSDDREYYVQVVIPLTATTLPQRAPSDLDMEAFEQTYADYLADVRRTVNNTPAFSFVPRIEFFDDLVRSINIE